MKAWVMGATAGLVAAVGSATAGAEPRFGVHDVTTLFAIGKNTDRNQVQYGIRLDANCSPVGRGPVYAYWRQYEKGPDVLEDLNFLDKFAYGILDQKVEAGGASAPRVIVRLRAASDRSIAIYPRRSGDACEAVSMTYISGLPARLREIHVQLEGSLSIAWVDLMGLRADDGRSIVERVAPSSPNLPRDDAGE